jgi:NCS2 family nucleobase:cation symporter-2
MQASPPLPITANLPLRYVFTYTGDNKAKAGFFDAIVLVMETGFAVTGFLAMILNLIIQEEEDEELTESLMGDDEREREITVFENAESTDVTSKGSGIEK